MNKKWILINECNYIPTTNDFYVYELINPTTQQPFYVGKGREDRAQRHISLRNAKKLLKANPHKCYTINKIIDQHKQLVIIKLVKKFKTEKQAFLFEEKLIKKYGRRCDSSGILTNLMNGGQGATSDGIPVDQFTMWGEYIKTYKNAKEAVRLNGWKYYSTICSCCKKRERSYKGFLWAYTGEQPNILLTARPIFQWTLDGNFIKSHRNTAHAAKEIGCDSSTISDCLRGYNRMAINFLWTYDKTVTPVLQSKQHVKRVKNIITNKSYNSVTEAALANGTTVGTVSGVCNGRIHSIKHKFCYI